jgi:CBS domain-containing protein
MSVRTKAPQLVKDVMTADPICIGADTSARELARILESNGISGVPVVDPLNRIIGVASKTDLLRRCVEGPLGSRPGSFFESLAEGLGTGSDMDREELGAVEDFMTTEPVTGRPDEALGVVAHRMAEENVHRIIVVDQRRHVVGIVTSLDVLREFPA